MAFVTFPATIGVRSLQWQPPFDTATSNRSLFTGGRQTVELPGGGRYSASGEFVPMIGQDASLDMRRFLAGLRGLSNYFALPAWEKRQASVMTAFLAPSALTNNAGTTITGRNVTKTAGTSAWDASVQGVTAYTGGGLLQFRPGQMDKFFAIGLNTDPVTDNAQTSLDYAFLCRSGGDLYIIESGTEIDLGLHYTSTSHLMISYSGTTIRYFMDGALLRSVTVAASITFYLDSSLYSPGALISDVTWTGDTGYNAGTTSASLLGFAPNLENALRAGWFVTAIFADGSTQLITLMRDVFSSGAGAALAYFDAPLRKRAVAIVADYPFAHMALSDQAGWGVDPGQIYAAGFTAEEAW